MTRMVWNSWVKDLGGGAIYTRKASVFIKDHGREITRRSFYHGHDSKHYWYDSAIQKAIGS